MPFGFLTLILLLWALFALGTAFDTYGWLMLIALAWCSGFFDGKRSDKTKSQPLELP
ncbi:MAG: hypothetical protein VKJ06_06625 [Vampirovibrionales bacterium]|nr:hypothetical protein [Vampirovibrionales bacterium]